MNAPQIHLMLNHVPVLGVVFVCFTLIAGLWTRRETLIRYALVLAVGVALAAIPVFLSGNASEDPIEHLPGVQTDLIERHEDTALPVTIGLAILGVASLVVLLRYRRSTITHSTVVVLLVASVAMSGAMAWTAHLGGQIRHTELRGSAATTPMERDDSRE